MLIKNQDPSVVSAWIKEMGGKKFIDSLSSVKVIHRTTPEKCPVCSNRAGTRGKAYMLVNKIGSPVIDDRFDDEDCAEVARKWLYALCDAHGVEKVDRTLLPLPLQENENVRAFARRYEQFLTQS